MAQIRIDRLRKEFGSFTAVRGSSFTIEDGEFFMLLGPSGCGKTTTLRMMAGLELPTSGEVYIDGEEVAQKRASQRDIAFVFQMFALYPHMTVGGNIGYPLRSEGLGRAETRARVLEVARLLGIEPILAPPGRPPLRRRPPARRPRPRHRPPAEGLLHGRAARRARRRVPRAYGRGAARAARPDGRHHRLRHPRPARGDADGRQDRGDEPRRRRAVRRAAGHLRLARHPLRRQLHRLAADELPPLRRRGPARRRPRLPRRRRGRRAGPARRRLRARSSSASAPSMSASTTPPPTAPRSSPPNTSAPPRS